MNENKQLADGVRRIARDPRMLTDDKKILTDAADRLENPKLDGWEVYKGEKPLNYYGPYMTESGIQYQINRKLLLATISDELTKPETPAQKYERITGRKACQHYDSNGGLHTIHEYIAWLEAGMPDEWGK